MTSLLQFLKDNLTVVPVEDDQVQVTVTIPSDYLSQYTQLLDSLTGFVQIVKREDKIARSRSSHESKVHDERVQQDLEYYYQRLAKAYDHYTSQGLDRNATIKQISADLRAEKHPWSSPDLVRSSLGKAGRGARAGRPRRKS